jgi:hypothetical protein
MGDKVYVIGFMGDRIFIAVAVIIIYEPCHEDFQGWTGNLVVGCTVGIVIEGVDLSCVWLYGKTNG